jgi:hypothetical protein
MRAGLVAAMTVAVLGGGAATASAEAGPTRSDAYTTSNPNEEGLFQLYGEQTATDGQVSTRNWEGSLSGWAPGTIKESRHWADNDYTEIRFTGCNNTSVADISVGVKLWQAIPFSLDKDMGGKTFTACYNGGTSQGEWDAHYSGGDNRYFTISHINGSIYTQGYVSVSKVYVDTTKAD